MDPRPTAIDDLPPDIPAVLLSRPKVMIGDDPGGYYCEHVFYTAQRQAIRSSGVLRNRWGEPLVGFLHVPGQRDPWLGQSSPAWGTPVQGDFRHRHTRRVVGRAVAGLMQQMPPTLDEVRLLVTGFGPFAAVADNPTGDFVSQGENLDAAMRSAIGSGPAGTSSATGAGLSVRSYRLHSGRWLHLGIFCLPTDDSALAESGPPSVAGMVAGPFRPQAVLSLGVARRARIFVVEHRASDRNLVGGRHGEAAARDVLPSNFALARALLPGAPTS